MTRYFFDMRINNDLGTDDEGVTLPDLQAAQREAMRVLADMAKELIDFPVPMSVEVRDDVGPVMQVRVVISISRTN
jgi:hypothetical protein